MRAVYRWLCAVFLVPVGFCWAGEGFSADPSLLPGELQKVWDSTFYVIARDSETAFFGSSFLVGRVLEESGQEETLYFLTGYHVVAEICNSPRGECPEILLTQELANDALTERLVPSGQGVRTFKARLTRFNATYDLALLAVTAPLAQTYSLNALDIAQTCSVSPGEGLVNIGHPGMMTRAPGPMNSDRRALGLKRWSHGFFLGLAPGEVHANDSHIYGYSTADALPGNSGGPVVSECGELLGLSRLISSPSTALFHAYMGKEDPGDILWHSAFVPCQTLSSFIRGKL